MQEEITTSILPKPETKLEKVIYYLFDFGDTLGEELMKIGEFSSIDSFNVLRSRNKESIIINKKNGTVNIYNLSQEKRESIEFQIKQILKNKQQKEDQKQRREIEKKQLEIKEEEFLNIIKEFFELNKQKTINECRNKVIYIDFDDFIAHNTLLAEDLINKPEETIQFLELALEDIEWAPNNVRVRFKNISKTQHINIHNIRTRHLGKLIEVSGRVSSLSSVRPLVTNAKFECPSCGTIISILQVEKKFRAPSRCSCGRRGGFKEIAKDMVDAAVCTLDGLDSNISVNNSMTFFLKEDLLESYNISKLAPGNLVKIIGVLKEVAITNSSGVMLTRFDLAIEVNNVIPMELEYNMDDFNEDDIKKFKDISNSINNNGIGVIKNSFAPHIEGMDYEKISLILQNVQRRNLSGEEKTKSHILFIGDPGSGKTQLAKASLKNSDGTGYTSCCGSSSVGLTCSVVKQGDLGYILKPGKLPLTREICVVDELGLMNEDDRGKFQEALSERQISVNKGGINARLNMSCGVIGIANPIRGNFDNLQEVSQQFNISKPILNRYDLIFCIRDNIDKNNDEKIAEKVILKFQNQIESDFDDDFLKKFFIFIRNQQEPNIRKEEIKKIKQLYSEIRKLNNINQMINPRLLESILRFSAAHAKLRMSSDIDECDIKIAFDLLKNSYLNLGDNLLNNNN